MFIAGHCSWSSLCWLETSTWCIVPCYQWDCSKLGWYGPYLGSCLLQWAEGIFILICLHLLVTSYTFSWKQNSCTHHSNSRSLLALGKATPFYFSHFRLIHLSVKSYWQIHHSILWKTVSKWYVISFYQVVIYYHSAVPNISDKQIEFHDVQIETMFEKYNFAGVFIQIQAVLSLYAQGHLSPSLLHDTVRAFTQAHTRLC